MQIMDMVQRSGVMGLLAILVTAILGVVGGVLLVKGQRPRAFLLFLAFALLPLAIGFVGTQIGIAKMEEVLTSSAGNASPEEWEIGRKQANLCTYVGAGGTAILLLLGLSGLAFAAGGAAPGSNDGT